MKEISRIGLDIAKRWFQVDGVNGDGKMVVSRKLARDAVLGYFDGLDLTEKRTDAFELMMPPMLQEASGFRCD